MDTFIAVCKRFLERNPIRKIAVHCTHGFNRTGFLISSYLVKEYDWDIEAALAQFAKSRNPGIYKQEYIDELFRRFDHIDNRLLAPELPDWCTTQPDQEDEKNGESGFSGIDANSAESIDGIYPYLDRENIKRYQKMCTSMCKFRKNIFPGSQPVSLSHENINMLQKEEYMVSWKADGTRYMLLIVGPGEMFFFDRDFRVFQLFNVNFLKRNTQEPLTNTLLDGELVIDIVNDKKCPRYLIYDIVCVDDQDVSSKNFRERLNIIFKQIFLPREDAKKSGFIDRTKEPIGIRMKDFCELKDTNKYFSSKFQKVLSHEIDGLIFQPVNMSYEPGRCDRVLKWKPPTLNSVDFKLCIEKETRPGMVEDYIGKLYVVGLEHSFATIKVNKTLKNYNNKIIECRFDMQKQAWIFMRERTDKSFPNAYTTAVNVCNSIRYPITQEYLLEYIAKYRFRS